MERYYIHLELAPYLRQWLIHDCGGSTPVRFKKLSVENMILFSYLTKLKKGEKPDLPTENTVAIEIPWFREKPPMTYNHMSHKAKRELVTVIRERFQISFWEYLHQSRNLGIRRKELILTWMTSHGIEPDDTNYFTLDKIYQRQRRVYQGPKRNSNRR